MAAHYILNSPGTGNEAIDVDSSGGIDVDAATQVTVGVGNSIQLSSGDNIVASSEGDTAVTSGAGAVYVSANGGAARRRLVAAAVSSLSDTGSVLVHGAQDVVLSADNTVALAGAVITAASTARIAARSEDTVEVATTRLLSLSSNHTATVTAIDELTARSTDISMYDLLRRGVAPVA